MSVQQAKYSLRELYRFKQSRILDEKTGQNEALVSMDARLCDKTTKKLDITRKGDGGYWRGLMGMELRKRLLG